MHLSSDQWILWQYGIIKLNGTIAITWVLMLILTLGAKLITRRLTLDKITPTHWQTVFEVIITLLNQQIAEVGLKPPEKYLSFLATLFLFIATANIFTVLPFYEPPTGSLSTTMALAICVFIAVPLFGIKEQGLKGYLNSYLEPTPIMLPFNLISDFSRTIALGVRLFGNMMSGSMIISILLIVTPFIFPIVMNALGLLTGMVQAYIFTILATVYIAAATLSSEESSSTPTTD